MGYAAAYKRRESFRFPPLLLTVRKVPDSASRYVINWNIYVIMS
jgi:hypothetical protein